MDTAQFIARVSTSTGSGSGHVIAPCLVLTSAHITPEVGGQVLVHTAADHIARPGRVVWRGTPHGHDDAALVQISEVDGIVHATTTRWGRLVTTTPGTPCEVWGFPYLVQREGRAAETAQLAGTVAPGNHYVNHRHMMDLTAHPPRWDPEEIREQEEAGQRRSLWAGLSGAAMRCGEGRLLVGVVTADLDHRDHAALEVVPVYVLHHDPGFRAVLAEHDVSLVLEPIELAHLAHSTTTHRRPSPASLLEARRQVVNFHGRDETMRTLLDWCREDEPLSAVVVHGPGGQGKTRLGYELTEHLAQPDEGGRRWATVWLTGTVTVEELAPIEKTTVPLLVVVDYAEARTAQLIRLLQLCDRPPGSPPVRLLLLVRTVGEWWEQVNTATDFLLADITRQLALPPLVPHTVERAREYRSALRQLAQALPSVRTPRPADWGRVAADLPDPDLSGSEWSTVLSVHMRALADLLDATQPATTVTVDTAVEGRVLAHEFRYWEQTAEAFGLGDAELAQPLRDVLALAFALTPADMEEADRLLAEATSLEGQSTARRHQIRMWIDGLYPTDGTGLWGYLQPDRLLEYFLGQRLQADPTLFDPHLEGIATADAERLVTLYARAAAHPALPAVGGHLTDLCIRGIDRLGPAVIDVATQVENPDPLVQALEEITTDRDSSTETLAELSNALPQSSRRLSAWADLLAARLVEEERRRAEQNPDSYQSVLAMALNNQAGRLADMGRHEEALEAVSEAVRIHLDQVQQSSAAHLPDLAQALNNQAIHLAALDRMEEALQAANQAVHICLALAQEDPDPHLPGLAFSLNNQAIYLGQVGAPEDALESVSEATRIYQALALQDPDTHFPRLAEALHNQASQLGAAGRHEEALDAIAEAAHIRLFLVRQRSDAHLPNLAMTLDDKADCLIDLGRIEEAVEAITEAIQHYRAFTHRYSDPYAPRLALALYHRAIYLGELGRQEEALEATTEAIHIHRFLAELHPDIHLLRLAEMLNNRAVHLGVLERVDEALDVSAQAVRVWTTLADEDPALHRRGLENALYLLQALRDLESGQG
ncbi:tetratricopeptide repeat protein [Nocardiopsis alba]|uniref:tetratricopeptide repeat protein n=1 Tax=Nocardiopsis alba TaxID=53437 RepID=UPI003D74FCFB